MRPVPGRLPPVPYPLVVGAGGAPIVLLPKARGSAKEPNGDAAVVALEVLPLSPPTLLSLP